MTPGKSDDLASVPGDDAGVEGTALHVSGHSVDSGAPELARMTMAGGKRPTINDIARLANVSKKTVSRVINQSPFVREATRAKIDEVIRQFGYAPDPQARGLAFRRSFLIGLVYDNPNASFIVNCQEGALDALRGSGFELVVHPCDRKSDDFVPGVRRFIERQKLHGVILMAPVSEDPALASMLREISCQHVRIASVQFDETSKAVVSNDREATAEAADYLTSLGHTHIGVIAGPSQHRSAHERLSGFLGALEARGVTVPPERIVEGGYNFESGESCARVLLALNPRPTAIFACNDEMAFGVYKTAHQLGIAVPGELSILGFDDGPMASRIWPPLTTIRLPIRDSGRIAALKLLPPRTRTSQDPPALSRISAHLVVRESCAAPRS